MKENRMGMQSSKVNEDNFGPCFDVPLPPSKESKFVDKKAFSIQIASDIHLEFYNSEEAREELFSQFIEPSAPYLALLGDIGHPKSNIYRSFLCWCATKFEKVLVVLGNHEFYGKEYYTTLENAKEACGLAGENVIYCNQTSIILNDHLILATTLWSNIPKEHQLEVGVSLNDYSCITIDDMVKGKRKLLPTDTVGFFDSDIAWIKKEIQNTSLPVIILTHHAPSMACSEPAIPPEEPLASAFCSSLEDLFQDPIIAWAFGHTHYPIKFKSGTCWVYSNPAGYPRKEFPTPYGRPYFQKGLLTI